jgi:hypothetical protein
LGDQIVQLGGVALDRKIPFPLMTKGNRFIRCIGQRHGSRGNIGHKDAEERGMVPGGAMVTGEIIDMSDMTSVLHDMNSILHQSVSINAKEGDCLLNGLVVIDVNP